MSLAEGSPAIARQQYTRLLSLASHELRTPLSVLGGYLRMLQRDSNPPLGELQQKMIAEAQKSCERITALAAELSDVSKLDTGTAALAQEPFDLFPALAQVAANVHEARDRGVQLKLSGDETGGFVRGDTSRLRAAFATFFRAVLREQPAACTVIAHRQLRTDRAMPAAVTIVASEAAFQKASAAAATSGDTFDEYRGGLGLLLPIARRVIERHGGRIWSPDVPEAANAIIVSLPVYQLEPASPE